jgi:hypothetical protein
MTDIGIQKNAVAMGVYLFSHELDFSIVKLLRRVEVSQGKLEHAAFESIRRHLYKMHHKSKSRGTDSEFARTSSGRARDGRLASDSADKHRGRFDIVPLLAGKGIRGLLLARNLALFTQLQAIGYVLYNNDSTWALTFLFLPMAMLFPLMACRAKQWSTTRKTKNRPTFSLKDSKY